MLHTQLHSTPTRHTNYNGYVSDTATTIVDNANKVITVEVNSNIINTIYSNFRQINELKNAVDELPSVNSVDTKIDKLEAERVQAETALKLDLEARLANLESLLHRLIPIKIEKVHLDIDNILEIGTVFTELILTIKTNKSVTNIQATISDNYDFSINSLSDVDYVIKFVAAESVVEETVIVNFGETVQNVSDSFYNMLSTIGEYIDHSDNVEGDEEAGYVRNITVDPTKIDRLGDIIVINT